MLNAKIFKILKEKSQVQKRGREEERERHRVRSSNVSDLSKLAGSSHRM